MNTAPTIIRLAFTSPRAITRAATVLTLCLALLATLPSLWPNTFSPLHPLHVDTDPENMLSEDEAVRVFHNRMKQELSLHDMLVIGVVDEGNPAGVFTIETLSDIYRLTQFAKTLHWPEKEGSDEREGVVAVDILAPSTLDNIETQGAGMVRFDWLMPAPPESEAQALAVRERALRIPFLNGTLVSEDGKAICLYLPLSSKDVSYRVYSRLQEKIAGLPGDARYYISGLPVAEDAFGVEMFVQMAISAPLAMLVIFALLWLFFRRLTLIVSAMIVALLSCVATMSLLVISGNTVHIMSSMIPIFIMPIAVLDSVHILSQFFDRYQLNRDRRATIARVMDELYTPMLYTSLTTAAGFASLALTPIPPLQVFGLFVALGVMLAWLLTVTFIPAYVLRMSEQSLVGFGMPGGPGGPSRNRLMAVLLHWMGNKTYRLAKPILVLTTLACVLAVVGMGRIQINDNPIRWFSDSHQIRVADRVLNEHFGGSYMAYLALSPDDSEAGPVFKQPQALAYIEALQQALNSTGVVGKSNSLSDILKTVHRELYAGVPEQFKIPASPAAVAQTLLTYENSHRPQDLWHFVTPDFHRAAIWVQMKSGDNADMSKVAAVIDHYIEDNPPPFSLQHRWFGLTYINVVWQQLMVSGMAEAFLGSFLVVFLMLIVLLRSGIWALLSMVPLTVSIGTIYGAIGLIGKDFDMPVAVLSALSLGLAVDFAIHFLVQTRTRMEAHGSWVTALGSVFGPPARAITRNGLVIALGFLPLLAAPLVPYQTVGVLIAAILITSGGATLMILPALIRVLEAQLFPVTQDDHTRDHWITGILISLALIGLLTLGLHRFTRITATTLIWVIPAMSVAVALLWHTLGTPRLVALFYQRESS